MRALAAVLFVGSMLVVASLTSAQPPEGGKEKGKGGKGGGFGPGGKGMFGPPAIGQIMPVFVQEQLKLTDAQKKDLETMQKDVDAKIEKLLTDEQKKTLKDLKERGPGRGPGGGPGGPGGPGGRGGNPPPPPPNS
jgi:Spy/CpxP family protein refolding chaperone